jgi:hypothetical protein
MALRLSFECVRGLESTGNITISGAIGPAI